MGPSMSHVTPRWKISFFYPVSLFLFIFVILFSQASAAKDPEKSEGPGTSVPILGYEHIQSPGSPHIPYNSDPPTSGPHTPYIAPWGIHNTPVPKEMQVHNLEDGGIAVQYNCSNCQELISKLEHIAAQYERIILAPYPGLDSTIALTAWGKIDKFNDFDEKRIIRFINAYIGIDHHPKAEK